MRQNDTYKRINSYNPGLQRNTNQYNGIQIMHPLEQSSPTKGFSSFPQQAVSDQVFRSLDSMLNKFESVMEKQNTKMMEFQSKLAQHLFSKLDKMIYHNQRISDGIERLNENRSLKRQQILSPTVSPRLQDFFKDKKEGSLKQSIISLNKTLPADGNEKPLSMLPPLPSLDQSFIMPTSKSMMTKRTANNQNIGSIGAVCLFPKAQSIKSSGTQAEEVVVALTNPVSYQDQYIKIHEWVGNFYTNFTNSYFEQYSTGKINYEDMKIRFSGDILNQLLNLSFKWDELKGVVKQQRIVQRRKRFYHIYTEASKRALQFQINKYPPSRRKRIDSQLSQKIKQTNNVSITKHDILRNAKMEIGLDEKQTDFTKQIKIFLNKLIIETNKEFPTFKNVMRDIFLNASEKSLQRGIQNDVQFLIGRKISDGTALYSQQELDAPGLQLKSPQLLRILMKWCQQLLSYFLNPEQKIFGNKFGFKNTKAGALPIKIPRSRLQQLATNLNKIFDAEIKPVQKNQYDNMGNLIMDLINLSVDGINGYEFLNKRQITIAKLSSYLNDSLKSYVLVFLNLMLKNLVKIRSFYQDQRLECNIHLVTFGVMDLLRCRCIGSKSHIYRIYNQILERKDYFQVIRIKNKLNEATRDILINLKLKNSFLICEVQLSLGQAQQQVNDHFCHFLYELQRTNFGVIFECASQICNLDPRMNYIKNQKALMFKGSSKRKTQIIKNIKTVDDHRCICSAEHPETVMDVVSNNRPFCCSLCTKFIPSYTLYLNLFKCSVCSVTLCPQCIIMMNRSNRLFIQRYTFINDECNHTNRFFYQKHLYQGMCESDKAKNKLSQYLQNYPYIMHVVANNIGYKRTIYKRYKNSYTQTFSSLSQLNKSFSSKLCWNFLQALKPFERKYVDDLKDYNKFHISLEWSQLQSILQQKQVNQIICVIDNQTKSALIVDIIEKQEQIEAFKLSTDIQTNLNQTNLNHQQFLQLTSKKLQSLDELEKIQDKEAIKILNLWENKIRNIDILSKFKNVKQLFLRQNQIQSIEPILNMRELELAFISDNKLKGPLPVMNLPLLNALDMSLNQITDVNNLSESHLDSLTFFRLVKTKVSEIPKMTFPKLQVFWFDHNLISDINNLFLSQIPELMKVSCTHNKISGPLPCISFDKLQSLVLNHNNISSIQSLSSSNLPNLKTLSLHHNSISGDLPYLPIPSLIKLDLSYNQISHLPNIFNQNFQHLQNLDLKCNQIKGSLPTFQLPSIRRIDLSSNFINNIESLSKSKMPTLIIIDISQNTISGALPTLKFFKLRQINLSNNQIVSIDNLADSRLPKLILFRCDFNRICTPIPRMYLESLKYMELSNNSIMGQQFVKYIHLLPSLKRMYLKDNPEGIKVSIMKECSEQEMRLMEFNAQFPN